MIVVLVNFLRYFLSNFFFNNFYMLTPWDKNSAESAIVVGTSSSCHRLKLVYTMYYRFSLNIVNKIFYAYVTLNFLFYFYFWPQFTRKNKRWL